MDGNMNVNDMQMRSCIVKLGIVSSLYGDFWENICEYKKSSFCAYVHLIKSKLN